MKLFKRLKIDYFDRLENSIDCIISNLKKISEGYNRRVDAYLGEKRKVSSELIVSIRS